MADPTTRDLFVPWKTRFCCTLLLGTSEKVPFKPEGAVGMCIAGSYQTSRTALQLSRIIAWVASWLEGGSVLQDRGVSGA